MSEPDSSEPSPSGKVQNLPPMYSLTAIGVATFISSVVAAGFMLATNYNALGQRAMAMRALWGGVAALLLFILIFSQLPPSPVNVVVGSVSQVFAALLATHLLQGPMLQSFREMGGQYFPIWRGVLVGVMAAFVTFSIALVFAALFLAPPQAAA